MACLCSMWHQLDSWNRDGFYEDSGLAGKLSEFLFVCF